jgi:hypothetical protein
MDRDYFDRRFDRLERLIVTATKIVTTKETLMAISLDDILAKTQVNTDAVDSATVLLNQLSDLIRAHVNDPAKLQQIADALDANDAKLAAAVVANTPADEGAGASGATGASGPDGGTGEGETGAT